MDAGMNELSTFMTGVPGDGIAALLLAVAFAGGLLGWSLLEYLIHGVLSHRFRTFVTPLHWGHHREPRAVFTSPLAWIPATLLLGLALGTAFGPVMGGAALLGVLAGFARYERIHWRIHFRAPRNDRERRRRDHHLAHHYGHPDQYHGVTTRLWDRVFGTLPTHWRDDYARASQRPALEGTSNWGIIWRGRLLSQAVRKAARGTREL
jgi:sterol desaturase/sphingolipid hydroxylase (fatty acid hydroxylase superfamily)